MLDTARDWRIDAADPTPPETLLGRTFPEAREILGRAPTPCPAAQVAGFDLATGQPVDDAALRREMRHEHLTQIFMAWPHALGLRPIFDRTWMTDDTAILRALFGPPAALPTNDFDMAGFLGSDDGIAPLMRLLGDLFGPRVGNVNGLELVDARTAFRPAPVENSPAARQAATPAMDYVEAFYGRGPLWRAMGRVVDLAQNLTSERARPIAVAQGRVLVPAPRGCFALHVATEGGRVAAFSRVTPTDHLLAPGGALAAMLASLPSHRGQLVPLLMTLIDPCRPVSVERSGPGRGD